MQITEVAFNLDGCNGRLRAFVTITLDGCFVIRDLKVIETDSGVLMVAMPSRKVADRCPYCPAKNALTARFCGDCGRQLAENRMAPRDDGRPKLYVDIAHPINNVMRTALHARILEAYRLMLNGGPMTPQWHPSAPIAIACVTEETSVFGEGLEIGETMPA